LFVCVAFASEEIEIVSMICSLELLNLETEFADESDEVEVIRVNQLAAKLTEHSFGVKVIFGEHPSSGASARFEDLAWNSSLFEAIGSRETGNACAEDSDGITASRSFS
jgi:hypothetical protein